MSKSIVSHSDRRDDSLLDRRRFLARLGLLAGAGALVPLTARLAPAPLETVQVGRPALGTWMRVVVRHRDRRVAERAIAAAFAAVGDVDAQMSVHRADSELARVNAAAGVKSVPVGAAVREVVGRAAHAARRSGGIYDPTVLPLMRLYGFYGGDRPLPPTAREIDATLASMGWDTIRLDPEPGTLGLERAGAGLDLGSIGKGWAVDRAADAMRAYGVRSALVDLGGKIYGMGTPDDGSAGWSVGVLHPVTGALDRVFVLCDAAVGTSGNTERWRVLGGARVGHLFDARRGTPANGHLSASVMSPTCLDADLLCTVAFLLGPDRFHGWPGVLDAHFIG